MTIYVYDPDGTQIKKRTYQGVDSAQFQFVPDKIGDYKIKASVSGNITGTCERTIKVVEKEHKYPSSWTVTRKADCTQTGIKTRICSLCGKTETQTIAKKSHAYDSGAVTKSATCNNAGEKTYTCTVCGATKTETIPATGHTIVKDRAVQPTDTEPGLTEGSHCSVCGKVIMEQKIIPVRKPADEKGDDMDSTHTAEEKVEASPSPVEDEVKEEQISIPLPTDSVSRIVKELVRKIKASPSKKKTGKISLRWRKVKGAKGYQLQYSLRKNLSGRKSRTVKRNRVTLNGLKAKRNYYIRIRPFTYTGSEGKQYGTWSGIRKFRTK